MGYKLIALDIDGTIRTIDTPISERTRWAVLEARKAGAVVTLATGRTFRSAARNSAELDIDVPISAAQGAYIAHPVSGEMLRHHTLTEDMTLEALEALASSCRAADSMQVTGYHRDGIYVSSLSEWAMAYGQRNAMTVHVVGDLRKVAGIGLTRLVVVGDDEGIEALERSIKPQLSEQMLVTRSLAHFCEILHPDGGKDSALAWMCDYYGIERAQTMAFGNGYNDVQMLNWAGLGVAVGDAVPDALAAADRIAPPLEEHGVAQLLEELLSQGLIG